LHYKESRGLTNYKLNAAFGHVIHQYSPSQRYNFSHLGTSKYSAISYLSGIMVGFTAYSIVQHRLMDINIVLKRDDLFPSDVAPIGPLFPLSHSEPEVIFQKIDYLFSAIIFQSSLQPSS
jgi:hypothetical protein